MKNATRRPAQSLPGENPGAVPLWECQFGQVPDGAELSALTVGAPFLMTCKGSSIEPWSQIPKLKFANEADQYALAILKLNRAEANEAEFLVTAYKVGEFSSLTGIGEAPSEIQVQGLKWKTQSVIEANPNEPPKPVGAFGAQMITWPWWLWVSLGSAILLAAVLVYWRVKKYQARQRLIEKIKARSSVLTPYAEFHKNLRVLLRLYEGRSTVDDQHRPEEYAKSLNEMFRQYMSREFLIPATEWSNLAILRDLRKRHKRIFKSFGKDIAKILKELDRTQSLKKIAFADCAQLHEMCRQVAERLERGKGGSR